MTLIYQAILAALAGLVGWNLFSEKEVTKQINCALVLIPMVLRVLLIK